MKQVESAEAITNAGNVPITPMKLVEPDRDEGAVRVETISSLLPSMVRASMRTTRSTRSFTGFHEQLSSSSPRMRVLRRPMTREQASWAQCK